MTALSITTVMGVVVGIGVYAWWKKSSAGQSDFSKKSYRSLQDLRGNPNRFRVCRLNHSAKTASRLRPSKVFYLAKRVEEMGEVFTMQMW